MGTWSTTPEQRAAIVESYKSGLSFKQCAALHGVKRGNVEHAVHAAGVVTRPNLALCDWESHADTIVALHRAGYGVKAIAKRICGKPSPHGVIAILRSRGEYRPSEAPIGSKLWAGYLEQEIETHARLESGHDRLWMKKYGKDRQDKHGRSPAMAHYYANLEQSRRRGRNNAAMRYARLKNDPCFKVMRSFRNAVSRIARNYGGKKQQRTIDYIGCTQAFARKWLETRFEPGMTWENYGKAWHIDHFVPMAAYNHKSQKEMERCCHYTNLRPLWAKENRAKSDKVLKQCELFAAA